MNYSEYRLSLDIHETTSQASFKAKLNDSARKILVTLRDCGKPVKLTSDVTAILYAITPAGATIYNATEITNDVISTPITDALTASEGIVECELQIIGVVGKDENDEDIIGVITSPRFTMVVEGRINDDDAVEGSNEYTALTEKISQAQSTITQMNNALDSFEDMSVELRQLDDGVGIVIDDFWGVRHTAYVYNGSDGASAYDIAVEHGYVGTESQWAQDMSPAKIAQAAVALLPRAEGRSY